MSMSHGAVAANSVGSRKSVVEYILYFALLAIGFFPIVDFIFTNLPIPAGATGVLHLLSRVLPDWKEGLLIVLYAGFIWRAKQNGERITWNKTRVHWAILISLAGALLSIVVNLVHPTIAFYGLKVLLEATLYFIAIVAIVDDEDTIRDMIHAMIVSIMALTIYGLYQDFSGMTSPSSWVYASKEKNIKLRVFSTIGNPNDLGGLMVLLAPICIALAFHARQWSARIIYGLCTLAMLYCLLHTYSRGAWGGFFIALVIYAILTKNKWLLGGLAVVVLGAAFFLRHSTEVQRVMLVFSKTYWLKSQDNGRAQFWGRALRIWTQHPVFGRGLGMVGDTVAVVHKVPGATWIDNQYIKVIAETGIVGLGTYLYMLILPVVQGFKYVMRQGRANDPRHSFLTAVAAGCVSSIAGMVAENATAGIFETTVDATYFWALCGILYAVIRIGYRYAKAEQDKVQDVAQ